ncbi:MAG: hypothetical protein WBX11_16145 [Thiobacillaceae bacterium]
MPLVSVEEREGHSRATDRALPPQLLSDALGLRSQQQVILAQTWAIQQAVIHGKQRFHEPWKLELAAMITAQNAIYPLSLMPQWLKILASVNPLTYLVDALRMLMIEGGQGAHSLVVNFTVPGAVFVVFVAIATRLYPTLIE